MYITQSDWRPWKREMSSLPKQKELHMRRTDCNPSLTLRIAFLKTLFCASGMEWLSDFITWCICMHDIFYRLKFNFSCPVKGNTGSTYLELFLNSTLNRGGQLEYCYYDVLHKSFIKITRNTCMQQPLAYIFQTLFQHEVFVIMPTLNTGSHCHVMLVMATR